MTPPRIASQNARVLDVLRNGARLTPRSALDYLGCFRLGARIYDLRQAGHNIATFTAHDDITGNPYAEYVLLSNAPPAHGLDASEGEE